MEKFETGLEKLVQPFNPLDTKPVKTIVGDTKEGIDTILNLPGTVINGAISGVRKFVGALLGVPFLPMAKR